ncbi:DUF4012 domain-containing protein [Candidatus Collierbacteria bacterium]|nr:DUF4012 domain-containing protein [Candidatus Collierbacteria bacterium]
MVIMKLSKLHLDPSGTPEPNTKVTVESTVDRPQERLRKFPKKLIFLPLVIIFFLSLLLGVAGFAFGRKLQQPATKSAESAKQIIASLQNQDLITAKTAAGEFKTNLNELDESYRRFSFFSKIPFISSYFDDGRSVITASLAAADSAETLIQAVEPYSDLLGFKTDVKSIVDSNSIEDRIVFIVSTLDKISPQLEEIAQKMKIAKEEVDKINPNRYPKTIFGREARSKIITLQSTISESQTVLSQAQPLIKLLPPLLGNPDPKLYLLLFQNDKELRPTGGFMTAYAYLKVSRGKIEPLGSFDIYDLDARWSRKLPAPEPIKKYLPLVSNWNLRDMNLNPDFRLSMETFLKNYNNIPGIPRVDGIIAMDTEFPVKLLEILGPIGVGGWGNFSAETDKRCDCPQVVYALEEIADRPVSTIRTGRKAVLGPLMHSIMANAMGSPKHLWPKLLNLGLSAIKEKHLLFYFPDEVNQQAAEDFNASGRVKPYDQDYLLIVDSNMGGAKTDMFISREVEQEIEINGENAVKTVTVTYNNPYKGSNCNLEAGQLCLNGTYRDWVRFYVPKGSKLISMVGSEVKETVSEDLGKTVFEGFFTMRPQSQSKLVVKYELPSLPLSPYKILIQKQPGKPIIKHTINLNGKLFTYDLNSDQEIILE